MHNKMVLVGVVMDGLKINWHISTNEKDWNKLQNKSDNRYDCGLHSINGGHIKNTHIKMGANCYGIKPKKVN